MSHGPESASHGENHEDKELAEKYGLPERIPCENPVESGQFTYLDQETFRTTHKDFLGRWYYIENNSMEEAEYRVKSEKVRNKRLKEASVTDTLEHGLYRINAAGAPIRPAKSSDEGELFTNAVTEANAEDILGNHDMSSPGIYITSGKGYGRSKQTSNEQAKIIEQTPAIVVSELERNDALAAGKSLEEAQTIGANTYIEQERFRQFNQEGRQPSLLERPEEIKKTKDATEHGTNNSKDHLLPTGNPNKGEDNSGTPINNSSSKKQETKPEEPETKEKQPSKEQQKLMKTWLRQAGRNAMIAAKTFNGVGLVDMTHYVLHKAGIPEAASKTLEFTASLPDSIVKEFRASIRTLNLAGKLLSMTWGERQSEARKRKDTRHGVDQLIVSQRIAKIMNTLGEKHPEVVLYNLYKTAEETKE